MRILYVGKDDIGQPPDAKEIGAALEKLRKRKTSLSRRQFALKIRVNRQKVNDIANGKKYPEADELYKWLTLCQTTMADFFNEPNPYNPYARDFKKYHDDLEYVLSAIGPEESTSVKTLKQECVLLEMRAPPKDHQRAGNGMHGGDAA